MRVRLDLAYHGAGFHGFAVQPAVRTVGGALVAALERNLRHTVEITCAGRTDAGVHAWGQVVSFDARAGVDLVALQRALNKTLRPSIVVRSATVAAEGFDARRWATGRTYRYSIWNDPILDPFSAATAWHVERPLDLSSLRLACDPLYGEHDFGSFCRKPPTADGSLVRRLRRAEWTELGGGRLQFEIEASSFCQQMVRAIVGTMVDMGVGKRRSGEMSSILRAQDRSVAGQLAPPHGLCLWNVEFGPGPVRPSATGAAPGSGAAGGSAPGAAPGSGVGGGSGPGAAPGSGAAGGSAPGAAPGSGAAGGSAPGAAPGSGAAGGSAPGAAPGSGVGGGLGPRGTP